MDRSPETGVESRRRDPQRPWYRYAERLMLPTNRRPWVDLGCGQGEFLERASRRGPGGIGLDRSPDCARATRALGRPVLRADLARALPFSSHSLDGAALIEVIEHVFSAERLMAELARVIRPGGWLILTTPNVAHLRYRWRALRGHPPKQEGRHLRFFTRQRLGSLVGAAGFRIQERASYGKRLGVVPGFAESLLARHFVWRLERLAGADG